MADKILMMIRQQKTAVGNLQAGVAYRFDMQKAEQAAVAKRLLEKEFAAETSEKELDAAKVDAEKLAEPSPQKSNQASAKKTRKAEDNGASDAAEG